MKCTLVIPYGTEAAPRHKERSSRESTSYRPPNAALTRRIGAGTTMGVKRCEAEDQRMRGNV